MARWGQWSARYAIRIGDPRKEWPSSSGHAYNDIAKTRAEAFRKARYWANSHMGRTHGVCVIRISPRQVGYDKIRGGSVVVCFRGKPRRRR